MVAETWLKISIPNSLILNNHNIFRWDRKNTTGGTVCILVSKLFEATIVAIPDELSTAELVAVDVLLSDVKQRFIFCYNPNDVTNETTIQYITKLCKCIEFVHQVDFTVTMCGDFNFSKANFRQASIDLNTTCQMFCDCIIDLGLNQLITEPTHGKIFLTYFSQITRCQLQVHKCLFRSQPVIIIHFIF